MGVQWLLAGRDCARSGRRGTHRTLRVTPATAAGVTDRLWSANDLLETVVPIEGETTVTNKNEQDLIATPPRDSEYADLGCPAIGAGHRSGCQENADRLCGIVFWQAEIKLGHYRILVADGRRTLAIYDDLAVQTNKGCSKTILDARDGCWRV